MSTSAFYDWWAAREVGPSLRELEEAYLLNDIIDLTGSMTPTAGRA